MLPEDDRVIETCKSVLNVLMQILDFLNNIYIYIYMCVCVCVCACVGVCNYIKVRKNEVLNFKLFLILCIQIKKQDFAPLYVPV